VKKLKCRYCGRVFEAADGATKVTCPFCGKAFRVFVFGLLRGRFV